jgi:hypothetical protein
MAVVDLDCLDNSVEVVGGFKIGLCDVESMFSSQGMTLSMVLKLRDCYYELLTGRFRLFFPNKMLYFFVFKVLLSI